ncbi:MAG: flagellar assembly protein FliX [Pseudomonadota bacterium]
MSGIRGVGGVPSQTSPARAPRGVGGFHLAAGQGSSAESAAGVAAAPVTTLSLLALQEAGALAERNARARSRGLALLAALASLQAALLRGSLDAGLPARLALLSDGEAAADPALAALLAEVNLRARVELARLAIPTDVTPE